MKRSAICYEFPPESRGLPRLFSFLKITKFLGLPKTAFSEYNRNRYLTTRPPLFLAKHFTLKGKPNMELIVINPNKLKIMLSAPDMVRYELETTHMDCADPHTRAAFRHIFDDARNEIGFDTEGERLLVQLYASKEGGCEIFVTKLGIPSEDEGRGDGERALLRRICGEEEDMTVNRAEQGLATPGVRRVAVAFQALEELLAACRRLVEKGYRGQSDVYIAETDGGSLWYLLLDIPESPLCRLPLPFAFLTEYGEDAPARRREAYLSEYGRLLCPERGVETFGRF